MRRSTPGAITCRLSLLLGLLIVTGCAAGRVATPQTDPLGGVSSPAPERPAMTGGEGTPSVTSPSSISPADASPSPEPSPTATPASPSATPTPRPSAKPAGWGDTGYAIGVKDPTWLGGKGRITISVKAGPTCGISVRYPSGATASPFARHTFAADGSWAWAWTIPTSAGTGPATLTTSCTLGGVAKDGFGSFTILAAAPTPTPAPTPVASWGLTGSVDSPVKLGGPAVFTGHITGTPPPGIAPIDLRCELTITYQSGEHAQVSEGSVQTRDFTLTLVTAAAATPGTVGWSVSCYPTAPGHRTVSGHLELIAG